MSFDSVEYFKNTGVKSIWKLIFVFAVAYIIYGSCQTFINQYIIDGFLSYFPQGFVTDALSIILIIYLLIAGGIKLIKLKLIPTISSVVTASFLVLLFIVIQNKQGYILYSLRICSICIPYSVLVLVSICYGVLNFQRFAKTDKRNGTHALIEDTPNPNNKDLIGCQEYTNSIINSVTDTTSESAFSIGIFAPWGAGKTDFLLRLKTGFVQKNDETKDEPVIILEFNPWRSLRSKSVIDDFFNLLIIGLKKYNSAADIAITNYATKVLGKGTDFVSRISFALLEDLMKDSTLQKDYDRVNSIIKSTGKKIVVFIDDLDRMSGNEIVDIFCLVRNTANFYNTFFIVPLDYNYVTAAIRNTNVYAKEEQYLKKIFQLVITLPQIRKSTFSTLIAQYLTENTLNAEEKLRIKDTLTYFVTESKDAFGTANIDIGIIEELLDDYRDIKRFCNSFKLNYEILKDDVELKDLLILELIKTNNFSVYQAIANKSILSLKDDKNYTAFLGDRFVLNSEAWGDLKIELVDEEADLDAIERALKILLFDLGKDASRMFSRPTNFYLYFSFQLFGLISLREFSEEIKKDWKSCSAPLNNRT